MNLRTKTVAAMASWACCAALAQQPSGSQPPSPDPGSVAPKTYPLAIYGLDCPSTMAYPPEAIRDGATGTTTAGYTITADGKLIDVGIFRSAGSTRAHKALDREVYEALRRCTARVVPPEGRRNASIAVEWQLDEPPAVVSAPVNGYGVPTQRPTATPQAYAAAAPAGPLEISEYDAAMQTWLSHPAEFGVRPKRVKYRRSVNAPVGPQGGLVPVHVLEFEMPDGTYGRGFANPVTWAFLGPLPYDRLRDADLVRAYTGWLSLFRALNNGLATTKFEPELLPAFLADLQTQGVTDITIHERYKVGRVELFSFEGQQAQRRIKGAGMARGAIYMVDANAPTASLPVIYTFLGLSLAPAR